MTDAFAKRHRQAAMTQANLNHHQRKAEKVFRCMMHAFYGRHRNAADDSAQLLLELTLELTTEHINPGPICTLDGQHMYVCVPDS